MSKPVAWSYSALTSFETCPWRHYLTKISKQITEPQSQAMAEGNSVHKAFENHIKGITYMPERYAPYTQYAEMVKMTPGTKEIERKFALTPDLRETTYFGKDVWVRGQFDVLVRRGDTAVIIDWKTGKRKTDSDQLKLFAAAAFALFPYLQNVHTGFAWLPDRKIDSETYEREEAPEIWAEFTSRVRRIEIAVETDKFPKKPSGLCRKYCPVGRNLCEHCGV